MSKLRFYGGKLLLRDGKLAMDPNCCCGEMDCVSVSEVIAFPSNRACFSFPIGHNVASADAGSFVVNGASGTLVQIDQHNVVLEFADEVATGDPWEITDGSQVQFDGGAVACNNQSGSVL